MIFFGESIKLFASQEISRNLWTRDVAYTMYKNPSPTFNLSELDLLHTPHLEGTI
jgi:hypothetical protein